MWPIGTIVVCVDDKNIDNPFVFNKILKENEYYTIRGNRLSPKTGLPGVYLNEIVGKIHSHRKVECAFKSERFRIAESTHDEKESYASLRTNQPKN